MYRDRERLCIDRYRGCVQKMRDSKCVFREKQRQRER